MFLFYHWICNEPSPALRSNSMTGRRPADRAPNRKHQYRPTKSKPRWNWSSRESQAVISAQSSLGLWTRRPSAEGWGRQYPFPYSHPWDICTSSRNLSGKSTKMSLRLQWYLARARTALWLQYRCWFGERLLRFWREHLCHFSWSLFRALSTRRHQPPILCS